MKSKELIRQIQEADPTGEEEVCVDNVDIHFLYSSPAYYDGPLQVLKRDENCQYYNIIGGKYKRTGSKVCIRTHSFRDAIATNKDFPIDYSELNEDQAESTKKAHDDLRQWHADLDKQLELKNFTEWAEDKAEKITQDLERFEAIINNFFEKHISPDDPYPEGGVPKGHSYVTMRQAQWNEKFDVIIESGFLKIVVK